MSFCLLVCHFKRLCAILLASMPFCSLACHFARFLCSTEHVALFSTCVQNKSKILIRRSKWHTARTPACHFIHCLLFSVSFQRVRAFTFLPKYPWRVTYKSSKALLLLNCFSDIDECATGTHNCSDHAVCNNNKGGHNCTCKKGFIGDGVNCTGNTFAFALIIKKKNAVFLFL